MTNDYSLNRILKQLGRETLKRLSSKLKRVWLEEKAELYSANTTIERVYFPINAVVSMVWLSDGEPVMEVATIGNEGVLGLPLFLGSIAFPANAYAQVAGESFVMDASSFRQELNRGGKLHEIMRLYTEALFAQVAQSAVCIRMHSVEQRACRWLLMCSDRVRAERFSLTQRYMAQMLGVRRASVNAVARRMQDAGLIQYHRGIVQILDRKAVEKNACECYEIVKKQYDRLLPANNQKRREVI